MPLVGKDESMSLGLIRFRSVTLWRHRGGHGNAMAGWQRGWALPQAGFRDRMVLPWRLRLLRSQTFYFGYCSTALVGVPRRSLSTWPTCATTATSTARSSAEDA